MILWIVYLCVGTAAGCFLLEYSCEHLNYEANNTEDKEKYHKLKTKAAWIAILGMFMLSTPILIGFLILIL